MFNKTPSGPASGPSRSTGGLFVQRPKSGETAQAESRKPVAPADVIDVEVIDRPASSGVQSEASPPGNAEKPSAFKGFSVKRRANAAAQVPLESAEKKSGFFSALRGSPKSKPEKAKPTTANPVKNDSDKLKKSKPSSRPSPAKQKKGALDVLVELEGGREVYWRVTATGLEEITAEDASNVASFTKADRYFDSDEPMQTREATDLVLAELGEAVRIVNRTKEQGSIYATSAQRVAGKKALRIAPGLMALVSQLPEGADVKPKGLLCVLVLKDETSGRGLIILHHFSETGSASPVQVTASAENVNFVISQFATANRLSLEDTKAVILTNDDLLKGAGALTHYPLEMEFYGVPLSALTNYAAIACLLGALGAGAFALQGYTSMASAKSSLAAATTTKTSLKKQLDERLLASVSSFTLSQSLKVSDAFQTAEALWVPGTTMTLSATPGSATYTLKMPLVPASMVGGYPSILSQTDMSDLSPLLSKEILEGCTKSAPSLTGALNAIQISITCNAPTNLFSSYWPK